MSYNFQANYVPLPTEIYPWQRFHRSLISQRTHYDTVGQKFAADRTREFVYATVEVLLDRNGNNGKHCVLRAICEAAKFPIKLNGVFDEVLHLFLTPNPGEVDGDYMDAMLVGKYGVDCDGLYYGCGHGQGILDGISSVMLST